jgi:hypothetical protein
LGANDIIKGISEILKIIDEWFGSAISMKLKGKEMQAALLLKEAGTLVRSMDHLYGTFNVLLGKLDRPQKWTQNEKKEALDNIDVFTSDWQIMPVIVGSLASLKARNNRIPDEGDKGIVEVLIKCGNDFLEQAGLTKDGEVDKKRTWPTPWVNAEQFDVILEKTMNARTDATIHEVRDAIKVAKQIFKQYTVAEADGALDTLKANIQVRYPRIPDPRF